MSTYPPSPLYFPTLPVIETILSFRAGGAFDLSDKAGLHWRTLLVSSLVYESPAHDVTDDDGLAAPQDEAHQRIMDLHISGRLVFYNCVEQISNRHFLKFFFGFYEKSVIHTISSKGLAGCLNASFDVHIKHFRNFKCF